MLKSYLRTLRRNGTKLIASKRNDKLFSLFIIFIFAVFFGSMACSELIYDRVLGLGCTETAIYEISIFAVLLVLATSFLGLAAIPLLVFAKGFVLSAVISSVYVYSGGEFVKTLIIYALPSLILMPCFMLISDDCMEQSALLLNLRFRGSAERGGGKLWMHLFVCLFFIVVEFLYCVYIIPSAIGLVH